MKYVSARDGQVRMLWGSEVGMPVERRGHGVQQAGDCKHSDGVTPLWGQVTLSSL